MFKKAKAPSAATPSAPTALEILADLETFEISQPPLQTTTSTSNAELEHTLLTEPESLTLETWWQIFDEYERKIRKLSDVDSTIDEHKKQLLACQAKLEKNAKKLREGIHKQQELVKDFTN